MVIHNKSNDLIDDLNKKKYNKYIFSWIINVCLISGFITTKWNNNLLVKVT